MQQNKQNSNSRLAMMMPCSPTTSSDIPQIGTECFVISQDGI